MKLTLRTARKLEAKIANRVNEGIGYNVTFSAYDNVVVREKYFSAAEKVKTAVSDALNLTRVRYGIRRQIQQLNEESGINQLVSDRKLLIETLSIWTEVNDLVGHSNVPVSVDIVEGKLKAIRDGGVIGTSRYSTSALDSVTVHVITNDFAETAQSFVRNLEREIEEIDDNILAANMGTKVTIPDDHVITLRDHALI